jgi:hypothetical protein
MFRFLTRPMPADDRQLGEVELLICPAMHGPGWSSSETPAILDNSRARSSIG